MFSFIDRLVAMQGIIRVWVRAQKTRSGRLNLNGFLFSNIVDSRTEVRVDFPASQDCTHYKACDVTIVCLIILRKEVIQPQVPLRLPCYDLVPIAEFTFGAWLPCGLPQRLRMPPTFVA